MRNVTCPECEEDFQFGSPFDRHHKVCKLFPGVNELREAWESEGKINVLADRFKVSKRTMGRWLAKHGIREIRAMNTPKTKRLGKRVRKVLMENPRLTKKFDPRDKCKHCNYLKPCRIASAQFGIMYCETPDEGQVWYIEAMLK